MGRPHRVIGAGVTYHVTARGNGKVPIFGDDSDRRALLGHLRRTCRERSWTVWAHCLMGNHFHLCVTTPEPDLSHGMRDVIGSYARAFNARYGFLDHLFGRRFGAVRVVDDRQLITVIRYIARNPLRAQLVSDPARWPWSSYAELLGASGPEAESLVSRREVLDLFHRREVHARAQLRQLVTEGTGTAEREPEPRAVPSVRSLSFVMGRRRAIAIAHDRGLTLPQIAASLDVPYLTVWRVHRDARPPIADATSHPIASRTQAAVASAK